MAAGGTREFLGLHLQDHIRAGLHGNEDVAPPRVGVQLVAQVPTIGGNLKEREIAFVAASPHHMVRAVHVHPKREQRPCVSGHTAGTRVGGVRGAGGCWSSCCCALTYPVPKVGAGCNPVELLVGIHKVLEISVDELLTQAQGRRHFLAVAAQQEPPVHVNKLWGKSNRRSSSGATQGSWMLMLQKIKSQSGRRDNTRFTTSHAF